jgi:hypothetical protein
MRRVGDFDERWVCPPSLRKAFAKRHADQNLRRAKAAVRQAELKLQQAQRVYDAARRRKITDA